MQCSEFALYVYSVCLQHTHYTWLQWISTFTFPDILLCEVILCACVFLVLSSVKRLLYIHQHYKQVLLFQFTLNNGIIPLIPRSYLVQTAQVSSFCGL